MKKFSYYSPTKVIFGSRAEEKTGREIASWGGTKVLLHYGGQSAQKSGLLGRIEQSLQDAGIEYVTLGGVVPNPHLGLVYEGIALGQKENVDFVLAVGGGSVIDSAKAIAVGLAHPEQDVWDFYTCKGAPTRCTPVGVVLTLSAAGSETSNSSVITDEKKKMKRSLDLDVIRPKFAVMNPELTYTLPPYQIACGTVDIMMHTMERYFSPVLDNTLTDRLAVSILKTMIEYGPKQLSCPTDYKAASEIMWCGSVSHNGITGLGNIGDWSTHLIEHELSGRYDVAHGAGLSAVWGSWARFVMDANIMRFVEFAMDVWGCPMNAADPKATALEGIQKTENFFTSLGMPVSLPELNVGAITEEDIGAMADLCVLLRGAIGGFKKLERNDIAAIYRMANA